MSGGIYSFEGMVPVIHPTTFVHPAAVVIGDVCLGPHCYIGPGASLRGDFASLVVGEGCNIQDNCVVHGTPGRVTMIEDGGHIGHGAVIHACHIGRSALIGIGAVIFDDAVIGEEAIVAALSFVKAGFEVPPRHLAAGVPAVVVRPLTAEQIAWTNRGTLAYQRLAARCLETLRPCEPLTEAEPGRHHVDVSRFWPEA